MALQPGSRLGPYEIVSTIGSGGMGEVYRCRDTRVPRGILALKVLGPSAAKDPNFRKRFVREARIISQLDHPNVCAFYDVGEVDGTPFLVMPMLEGRSLAEHLREGPIPIAEALRIAVAVASALAYAHGRGVLHRDVKPGNIMLGTDGSVKLVDFGIARTLDVPDRETRSEALTKSGHVLGTLEYMSPEQLSGREIDERSDIFSLAVVVYEMVAGRHPFRAAERVLTLWAILDCKYPPMASSDPLVKAVDVVLAKSMSRDPDERDASMAEFVKELTLLQEVKGRSGREPAHAPRRTWNARTVGALFVATAAGGMVVALLWGNGIAGGDRDPTTPAPNETPAVASPSAIINARPPGVGAGVSQTSYERVSPPLPASVSGSTSELGVTVWRMRRATAEDPVRLLVHETGETEEWTAERIALGTPLSAGEHVRISVESPREGYLYVVDRERYADGTTGTPLVIFPTSHTRSGDNRLASGRLVDIPSQTDRPPYFTVRSSRKDQIAEVLTLIVSDRPVPELTPRDQPLVLSPAVLAQWEARGSPQIIEQLELSGGAGRAWSAEEQRAAADATRVLTQDAPAPQTVFRIVTKEPGILVTQVVLAHRRP